MAQAGARQGKRAGRAKPPRQGGKEGQAGGSTAHNGGGVLAGGIVAEGVAGVAPEYAPVF